MRRVGGLLLVFGLLVAVLVALLGLGVPRARTARPHVATESQQPDVTSPTTLSGRRAANVRRRPIATGVVTLAELQDDPNRISGAVTLRGVVTRAGKPVPTAAVRICRDYPAEVPLVVVGGEENGWREWPERPDPLPFAETRTNDRGEFSIRFARRSRVVVELYATGSALDRRLLYLPLEDDLDPVRFELEPGHVVTGRVVRPSGDPVAGADVALVCPGGYRFARMTRITDVLVNWGGHGTAAHAVVRTRTDEHGVFRFADAPSGVAEVIAAGVRAIIVVPTETPLGFVVPEAAVVFGTVRDTYGAAVRDTPLELEMIAPDGHDATARGRTDAQGWFRIESVPAGTLKSAVIRGRGRIAPPLLEIEPGKKTRWDPVLPAGAVVFGTAVRDGVPVADVRVRLLHRPWAGEREEVAVLWTDRDGGFHMEGVPAGAYSLQAQGRGLVWRASDFVIDSSLAPVEMTLDLVPGARVVGRLLGLPPGWRAPKRIQLRARGYGRIVWTDERGRFAFEHLPPLAEAHVGIIRGAGSGAFEVVPGHVHEVDLNAGGETLHTIRGVVLDDNGSPVPDAIVSVPNARLSRAWLEVRLMQTGQARTITTDAAGRFELTFRWHARLLAVQTAHPAFTASETLVKLRQEGGTHVVEFVLRRGRPISGRVLDARGRPLPGVVVTLRTEEELKGEDGALRMPGRTRTDVSGRFMFGPRAAGRYGIAAYPPGTTLELSGVEPGTTDIVLRYTAAGFIAGRVVDDKGRPASELGLTVAAAIGTGEVVAYAEVDRAGRFRIANLPPGRYDISADPIFQDGAPVKDVATGTNDLILRLPPEKDYTFHVAEDGKTFELRYEDGTTATFGREDE